MANSESKDKKVKGFAGLNSMVSDVSVDADNESKSVLQKTPSSSVGEVPNSTHKQAFDLHVESSTSQSTSPKKDGGGLSMAGWIFLSVLGILFIYGMSSGGKESSESYTLPSSSLTPSQTVDLPAPTPTPVLVDPEITKPPVGQNRVLNVSQIRYCQTEKIRINAFESMVNKDFKYDIDHFNDIVHDYNSRCGEFRSRSGDVERAQREIDLMSASISAAAKSEWVRSSPGLRDLGRSVTLNSSVNPEKVSTSEYAMVQSTEPASRDELSQDEKESIESACSPQKTIYGPAAYNKCLSGKLSALKSGPRNIDLSGLNYEEKESIEGACSPQKTIYGPAAYNKCLSGKLSALKSGPRNIDLSGLNYDEKESIEGACSPQKTIYGPAAYNKCLSGKLSALKSGPRNIDLSSLNYDEKESIEGACSPQKTIYGPAAYNNCLIQKLRQLKL